MLLIPKNKPESFDFLDSHNRIRIVTIREVRTESPFVKTFTFRDKLCKNAMPGQFLMVWIPGVDEIPLSISAMNLKGLSSITVAEVGEATKALLQKKSGEAIGIRGPYGKGFTLTEGKIMIVGGGTGLIPLTPLAEKLVELDTEITFLLGAKTKNELFFLHRIEKELKKMGVEIIITTEDGSYGFRGVITEQAELKFEKEKFDMIYVCGPEEMIHIMFLFAERNDAALEASFERIIRCAIGLCGSCTIGKLRVCKEGPVFSSKQLRNAKAEFGKFKRDFNGRKIRL